MADEKLLTFNLRRFFNKAPNYKRSSKAIRALTALIARHMKVKLEDVRISSELNSKIWERGRKNPPAKIKIKATIMEKKAYAQLPEVPFVDLKPKDEKKKKVEEKPETKTEEKKKEDIKALEKEELKELKKEHKPDLKEVPSRDLREAEKVKDQAQKQGKIIGSSGKKGAKEPKP